MSKKQAYTVLEQPYTEEEIRANVQPDGKISGVVPVDFEDIFSDVGLRVQELEEEGDEEGYGAFADVLSETLIGRYDMRDREYKIVGFSGDTVVHVKITGYIDELK